MDLIIENIFKQILFSSQFLGHFLSRQLSLNAFPVAATSFLAVKTALSHGKVLLPLCSLRFIYCAVVLLQVSRRGWASRGTGKALYTDQLLPQGQL